PGTIGPGPLLLTLERSTWRTNDNARTVLFVMDTSGPLSATWAAAAAAAGSPLKSTTVTRSPPESRGSGPASNVESMSWISADGVVLVNRAPSSMAKPEQHAPGVPKAGPNP